MKFSSITELQTKGLKRHFHELQNGTKISRKRRQTEMEDNTVADSSKQKRLLADQIDEDSDEDKEVQERDYNKIGVNDPSSSSEDDSDDEIIEEDMSVDQSKPNVTETKVDKPTSCISVVKEEKIEPNPEKPMESKPATYIHLNRTSAIQEARLKLPILSEEQVIMEAINENPIVIIAGETGSGKTTQVPQFLYEAGFAENQLIGITEPRRVAAISMSKRVATEMNLSSDIVSYLIRFEGNTTDKTKVKFMTDGVLLKEIENDFLLSKYSVIILDEAHERSIYTDILIGLLSRIVPLRNKKGNPLKLIIMSATLRVADFTENKKLFKTTPPVLTVDARQFPVTVHFNKRTHSDYVHEAYKKTIKIHTQLPDGGILVFLTGQQEVHQLVKKLRKSFPILKGNDCKNNPHSKEPHKTKDQEFEEESDDEFDMKKAIKKSKQSKKKLISQLTLPKVNLDNYQLPGDDTEADLHDVDSDSETRGNADSEDDSENEEFLVESNSQPLWVLPLYSLLSSDKQSKVFDPPPEGTRLCIVATNVAETSLTIPNIKYVIDSGRQKTRLYDKVTGVSAYVVTYCSKASANQRAGRAGRTGPGHCYRLYSSAVFNDELQDFSVPEIQKKPVDDLMLQMKCMGIDRVINFPFPSPPDLLQLEVAEKRLQLLGALEDTSEIFGEKSVSKVTKLGRAISAFPVAPRFGKMLALSHQHDLLPYTICMVAALSVQEVLQEVQLEDSNQDDLDDDKKNKKHSKLLQKRLSWAGTGNSLSLGDPMVLLRAVGASEFANSTGKLSEFCAENGLRQKAIIEIRKLRVQLTNEINLHIPDLDLCVDPKMPPPSDIQAKFLRQILLAGMNDQVARKIPPEEVGEEKQKLKYAYKTPEMEDPLFMHSASVLRKSQPEWVVYQEAYELQNKDNQKMILRGITEIDPEWLVTFAPKMCNFDDLPDSKPYYNNASDKILQKMRVTFGKSGWELPNADVEVPFGSNACKYFGLFFLNGEVFEKLEEYQPKLLSTPTSVIKVYNKLIPRVDAFIKALLKHKITSKQQLENVWKRSPKCKWFLN